MIITKIIDIHITKYNKTKYKSNVGDIYKLPIEQLTKGSNCVILAKCDYCGNEKSISYKDYNKNTKINNKFSCSYKCGRIKLKENNMEKYGVESTFQLDDVKLKIKETLIKNYGVEHVSNIEKVSLSKKSKKVKDNVKDKIKKTWNNKTHVEIEIINNNRKTTVEKKYNVDNISKLKSIKDKKEKTFKDKYDGYTLSSNILKNKVNDTLMKKYDTINVMSLDFIKEKRITKSLICYGVEYPQQTLEIKNKIKNTMVERYGVDNIMFSEDFRKHNFIISSDVNYIKYIGGRINEFVCDCGENHHFKIDTDNYFKRKNRNCKLCTVCYPISENVSIKEKEMCNYIKSVYNGKVIENYRDKLEIDVYLPELNIGFEFNGLYWHSDKFSHKNKHIDKLNYFKNKNIRIIYVWEDDWDFKKDIMKSQISNWLNLTNNRIYARKCEIREITDVSLVRTFLNETHIQGFIHSSKKIGLYYENELVSIMLFDKMEGRKSMKDGEWNLSRFCSVLNTNIIGGFSKLLKYFISNNDVKRMITYADKEWSLGTLYLKNDFKLISESKISYKYVVSNKRLNKQKFKKSNLVKMYNNVELLTEREIMNKHNINRCYDCGQFKFEKIF